jgi:FeS assembly SUF system protein
MPPVDDDRNPFDFADKSDSQPDGAPAAERFDGADDPVLLDPVIAALRTVHDPEIPVNLVDLGLIYELDVKEGGRVFVEMTLTTPSCPVAGELPGQVEEAVRGVPGVCDVRVNLVWTPPWTQDRLSEEAKLELGLL